LGGSPGVRGPPGGVPGSPGSVPPGYPSRRERGPPGTPRAPNPGGAGRSRAPGGQSGVLEECPSLVWRCVEGAFSTLTMVSRRETIGLFAPCLGPGRLGCLGIRPPQAPSAAAACVSRGLVRADQPAHLGLQTKICSAEAHDSFLLIQTSSLSRTLRSNNTPKLRYQRLASQTSLLACLDPRSRIPERCPKVSRKVCFNRHYQLSTNCPNCDSYVTN